MVEEIFSRDSTVKFVEDTHQYFTKDGKELKSVTRLIKSISAPFDKEKISGYMAKSIVSKTGVSLESAKASLLQEWEIKRKSAEVRGNWIHDNLESYLLTGKYDLKLNTVIEQLQPLFKNNYRFYTEALIYSLAYGVAGQSDLVVQRNKGIQSVFDIFDYKTNESKGIQFDSISRKDGEIKHYNRYMLPPFDHIEDCNYYQYALQLSLYAYMCQETWNLKIGRLAILFVDNDLQLHIYPVPYMMYEAEMLLVCNATLKPLPPIKNKFIHKTMEDGMKVSVMPNPLLDSYPTKENDDNDDW